MERVGGRGYSLDLRRRIVDCVKNGENVYDVARKFSVNQHTVRFYLMRDELGILGKVRKSTGRPTQFKEHHMDILVQQLKASPDMTLKELAQALFEATGILFSTATIHRKLKASGYTYKKNGLRSRAE